jgi:hypothetical protein
MRKQFLQKLRSDIKVNRVTCGGRHLLEVSGHGLTYFVPSRGANADVADLVNSKIPAAVIRPPNCQ